jgi:hypothetical protein
MEAFEDLITRFAAEVADDSAESVAAAIGKSHRSHLIDGTDLKGVERADDAVRAARKTLDPHLRDVVNQHVGPGHALKSMEEFEALRHMKAADLTAEQVNSLNSIRRAMGVPPIDTDLVKVVDLNTGLAKIGGGDPNLGGFFVTKADLGPANSSQEMIDALRLDYDGTAFSGGGPHVVIETKMTDTIQSQARIPRNSGYANGDGLEFVEDLNYPNTGNGFISSKDGRLRPESRMQNPAEMPADVTVMKFKNADGTAREVEALVDGVPTTASEWKLVVDPLDPARRIWVPNQ